MEAHWSSVLDQLISLNLSGTSISDSISTLIDSSFTDVDFNPALTNGIRFNTGGVTVFNSSANGDCSIAGTLFLTGQLNAYFYPSGSINDQ